MGFYLLILKYVLVTLNLHMFWLPNSQLVLKKDFGML